MSAENVKAVRELFRDLQALVDSDDWAAVETPSALATDFEWVPPPGGLVETAYRGREGFLEFMRMWTEDFDQWSIWPERVIEAGDDIVFALAHQSATGKGSGVEVELTFGAIFEFEGDRVTRVRSFFDPAEALEAAGLSE